MDTLMLELLKSVKDQPRQLSLGHSSVEAISTCFRMIDEGLVTLGDSEYHTDLVFITEKGKKVLEENGN